MPDVVQDHSDAIEAAVRDLLKSDVLIGIPAEADDRKPEPGEKRKIGNAEIGYIMEYGAPEANIPARPHLEPGVEDASAEISFRMEKAAQAALEGDAAGVQRRLEEVGIVGMNAVRKKITDGPFAPLSDRTLAARRRRGRTGEKPLIDTGQYRRSVTYVVRPRGSE